MRARRAGCCSDGGRANAPPAERARPSSTSSYGAIVSTPRSRRLARLLALAEVAPLLSQRFRLAVRLDVALALRLHPLCVPASARAPLLGSSTAPMATTPTAAPRAITCGGGGMMRDRARGQQGARRAPRPRPANRSAARAGAASSGDRAHAAAATRSRHAAPCATSPPPSSRPRTTRSPPRRSAVPRRPPRRPPAAPPSAGPSTRSNSSWALPCLRRATTAATCRRRRRACARAADAGAWKAAGAPRSSSSIARTRSTCCCVSAGTGSPRCSSCATWRRRRARWRCSAT